jgi:hypothetical protein
MHSSDCFKDISQLRDLIIDAIRARCNELPLGRDGGRGADVCVYMHSEEDRVRRVHVDPDGRVHCTLSNSTTGGCWDVDPDEDTSLELERLAQLLDEVERAVDRFRERRPA